MDGRQYFTITEALELTTTMWFDFSDRTHRVGAQSGGVHRVQSWNNLELPLLPPPREDSGILCDFQVEQQISAWQLMV